MTKLKPMEKIENALKQAEYTFLKYAKHHRDKGTIDGFKKSVENELLAHLITEAVKEINLVKSQIRQETINEIINDHHKNMIKFFEYEQKYNFLTGPYAHVKDIEDHKKQIKVLEAEEWTVKKKKQ